MDHNPEDVGSKPTTGIYSFMTSFTEIRPMLLCYHCLPSGSDLVKKTIDLLGSEIETRPEAFFYLFFN